MTCSRLAAGCLLLSSALPSCATHVEARRLEKPSDALGAEGVVYQLPKTRITAASKYERVCSCASADKSPRCVDRYTEVTLGSVALPDEGAMFEIAGPESTFASSMFDVTLSESGELTKVSSSSTSQALALVTSIVDFAVSMASAHKEKQPTITCDDAVTVTLHKKLAETDSAIAAAQPAGIEALAKIRKDLVTSLTRSVAAGQVRCHLDPGGKSSCVHIMERGAPPEASLVIGLAERADGTPCTKQSDAAPSTQLAWRQGIYYRRPHWCTASVTRDNQLLARADVAIPQFGQTAFLSLAGAEFSAEAKLELSLHSGTGALQHVKVDEVAFKADAIDKLLKSVGTGVSTLHQTEAEKLKAEVEILKLRKEKAELEAAGKK